MPVATRLRIRIAPQMASNNAIPVPAQEIMVVVWLVVDHLNPAADGSKRLPGNRHGKKVCGGAKRSSDGKGDYNVPEASVGYDAGHDSFVYGYM